MTDPATNHGGAASPRMSGGAAKFRMQSSRPANKVTAATVAVAVVELLLWLNRIYGGPEIPTGVSSSLLVLATLLAGYLMPPSERDQVVRVTPAQA